MRFFRNESDNPRWNAQRNLSGLTHYADDETLKFFHARILSARPIMGGAVFAVIEAVAADMNNAKRETRYALFAIDGHVIDRPKIGAGWRTRRQAEMAMWEHVNTLSRAQVIVDACERVKSRARMAIEAADAFREAHAHNEENATA